MQLGVLTRLLSSTSLLNHSLEKDYQALSVAELLQQVKAAVCPTWYGKFVQEEKKPDPYGSTSHSTYGSSSQGGFGGYSSRGFSQPSIKQQLPHTPHECPAPGNAFHVAIQSIAQEVSGVWSGLCLKSY